MAMEFYKQPVYAILLVYCLNVINGAPTTETRLEKLERITEQLLKENAEKDQIIEQLQSTVRDQNTRLKKQNYAITELGEVIRMQKYENEAQNEEHTKRMKELEDWVKRQIDKKPQGQSDKDDGIFAAKEGMNVGETFKTHNLGTTDAQNNEEVIAKLMPSNETDMKMLQLGQTEKKNSLRIRRQASDNVAFHVYLSGPRCYASHETFVFDVEETDIGGGYNINDGIYDVRVTGTYVFVIMMTTNIRRFYSAEIIINGQVKGIAYPDSEEVGDISTSTAIIVVHVNAGDHVFVRRGTIASNNCDVHSNIGDGRSTFSGWLLF